MTMGCENCGRRLLHEGAEDEAVEYPDPEHARYFPDAAVLLDSILADMTGDEYFKGLPPGEEPFLVNCREAAVEELEAFLRGFVARWLAPNPRTRQERWGIDCPESTARPFDQDRYAYCRQCTRFETHRYQPSPDAGPGWRCGDCGSLYEGFPHGH